MISSCPQLVSNGALRTGGFWGCTVANCLPQVVAKCCRNDSVPFFSTCSLLIPCTLSATLEKRDSVKSKGVKASKKCYMMHVVNFLFFFDNDQHMLEWWCKTGYNIIIIFGLHQRATFSTDAQMRGKASFHSVRSLGACTICNLVILLLKIIQ